MAPNMGPGTLLTYFGGTSSMGPDLYGIPWVYKDSRLILRTHGLTHGLIELAWLGLFSLAQVFLKQPFLK